MTLCPCGRPTSAGRTEDDEAATLCLICEVAEAMRSFKPKDTPARPLHPRVCTKGHNIPYLVRCPECRRLSNKRWYLKHTKQHLESCRAYRTANPEIIRAISRRYDQKRRAERLAAILRGARPV